MHHEEGKNWPYLAKFESYMYRLFVGQQIKEVLKIQQSSPQMWVTST